MTIKSNYFINVFAQGIGRVASSMVGLIVFVLVARYFGTDIFGKFSYILTFLGLFAVAVDFGTQPVFSKEIFQAEGEATEHFGNFLLMRAASNLIVMSLGVLVAYLLRRDLFSCLLAGCLAMPFLSSRFFDPLYQMYDHPRYAAYSTLAYSVVYLVFSLTAVFMFSNLFSLVFAYLLANVIYTLVAFGLVLRLVKPTFRINVEILRRYMRLSLPIGVSSLFTIINSRADVFMLAYMRSDYDVGVYNAAYKFLDVAVMLIVIFMNPIIPVFSQKAARSTDVLKTTYIEIIELLAVVLIPLATVVPHISPFLVETLFGREFSEAARVLNILSWAAALVFFSLISSVVNLSVGDVTHAYWNAALAASINVVLNYFWIPKYSFVGSAWATVISEICLLAVCLRYVNKNMGNVFDWGKWARIFVTNGFFYGVLNLPFITFPFLPKLCIAILGYLLLVYSQRLVSTDMSGILSFIRKGNKNEA